jgi:hypothetical protein
MNTASIVSMKERHPCRSIGGLRERNNSPSKKCLTNYQECDIIHTESEVMNMTELERALLETFQVELESTDVVVLKQSYCEPTIVDVVVEDTITGEMVTFECFDTRTGVFPYGDQTEV